HDSKRLRLDANVLLAALACGAGATADPRMNEATQPAPHVGERSRRDDLAANLVARRDRQMNAALGQGESLAATQVVTSFPNVQIGVAKSRRRNANENLRSDGLGNRSIQGLERFPVPDNAMRAHARFSPQNALPAVNLGTRFSRSDASPSRTSAPVKPSISSASDASNAGPAIRSQLFRLYFVQRSAVCDPCARRRATSRAVS